MIFEHVFVEGLAHSSYVIGSDRAGAVAVIDPKRDVEDYLALARRKKAAITHVIETHIHADFASGARELAAATGATVYGGPGAALEFQWHEARDGEHLELGEIRLQVLHTPGHTPEHISITAADTGRAEAPWLAFTGDCLFVGDVGRPDLLGEPWTRQLAGQLYDSIFQTLLALDDGVEIYPAHGEGSLCGRNIGSKPSSTIGFERRFNPALQIRDRARFIETMVANLPERPPYFARVKQLNKVGPALLGGLPQLRPLLPREAAAVLDRGGVMIDTREPAAFGGVHVPNALNIGFGARLGYWAGWVVPPGAPIVLLTASNGELGEAVQHLIRVGFDDVAGYLEGGIATWQEAGLPVARMAQLSVHETAALVRAAAAPMVLDVRTPMEYQAGHIPHAVHMPVGQVPERLGELEPNRPVAVVCGSGYRASLVTSLLERAGFRDARNVSGGMTAWTRAGNETVAEQPVAP